MMSSQKEAGGSSPSIGSGVGTSVPSNSIEKNGTEVPAPGYKQTKVGVIPEDWGIYRIDNVLQRIRKKLEVEKEVMYQQIGIRSHAKGIFHKELVSGEALGNKSVFWIEEDCFIVNIVFAWEQAVAKTTDAEKGMIASHRFPMYKAKDNKVDIDYILYFFKSRRGKHLLGLASPGGAGRNKTLGQKEFSELKLPLPSLKEQQKIAQILSTWDDAISKQDDLIKAKEILKKGLMQKLLSGEVRFGEFGVGTSVPSNGIEKNGTEVPAPSGWEEIRLREVLKSNKLGGNYKNSLNITKNPLIKMGNINRGNINVRKIEYIVNEEKIDNEHLIKYGDLFFNTRNTLDLVGKVAIWRNELDRSFYNSNLMRLKFSEKIQSTFFMNYLFNTEKILAKLKSYATGTTSVAAIYTRDLLNLPIKLPPIQEQQKIAQVLTLADKDIELLKEELETLKEQKRGLMQGLLSGVVRV